MAIASQRRVRLSEGPNVAMACALELAPRAIISAGVLCSGLRYAITDATQSGNRERRGGTSAVRFPGLQRGLIKELG